MANEPKPVEHPKNTFAREVRAIIAALGSTSEVLTHMRDLPELKRAKLYMKPDRLRELSTEEPPEVVHIKVRTPSNTELAGLMGLARVFCDQDPEMGDRLKAAAEAWKLHKEAHPTGIKPKKINKPEEALELLRSAESGKVYAQGLVNDLLELLPGHPGAELLRQMREIYDDVPRREAIMPAFLHADDRTLISDLHDRFITERRMNLNTYPPLFGVLLVEVLAAPLAIPPDELPHLRERMARVCLDDPIRQLTDDERQEGLKFTMKINAGFGSMKKPGSDDGTGGPGGGGR